ncbi:TylF/MycF/NovP-related O-methyltransferase [Candidatus Palauibacter sp.]|uniref:TylF/MycF/NovP-related O-methyltransferase n=1 Tax=Candidatus Palauibacter sp. TaxID=3101350 RepID=UPI003D0CC819
MDPGVLAAMLGLIDATRRTGAAVVEIGVGRGDSSVFILEHLSTTRDPRDLVLVDTFGGFTPESIAHETGERRKTTSEISDYSYLDDRVYEHGLKRLGYSNYRIVKGDCAKVNWADVTGPVGAVLLDVDLYLPTRQVLDAIWPLVVPGGGLVLDDCIEPSWADGALQAYTEFTDRHALPFVRVGRSGGLIVKQSDEP